MNPPTANSNIERFFRLLSAADAVTIDDGASGVFSGALSKAETDAITSHEYTHDLVLIKADGTRIGQMWQGVATVEELNSQIA